MTEPIASQASPHAEERVEGRSARAVFLWRFYKSLRLTHVLSPLILLLIVGATALPQLFIWATGALVECGNARGTCERPLLGTFDLTIPITLGGLVALIALAAASRILAWIAFELSGQWSSQRLHAQMIASLSRVRVSYFDEVPSGRLLNRMTGDYENLRFMGVIRIGDSLNAVADVLFIALVVFVSSPAAAVCVLPVLGVFFYLQRQVSPMLGHTRSVASARAGDVLHRETDLVEGGPIFSLYGKRRALLGRIQAAYRRYLEAEWTNAHIWAWGKLCTGSVTLAYATLVVSFVAFALAQGNVSRALAAVILTAVFRLTPAFTWLVWSTSYLTESMANAQRVYELVDLPDETRTERGGAGVPDPSPTVEGARTSPARPLPDGDIVFRDFTMSYRSDTPIILRELNLTVRRGTKVGVIGRTGAGKSSLVQSVFRMAYVHSGDIAVGGVSIYDRDISEVRRLLGIVPQNPYLFEGTLRLNLDRTLSKDDADLERALADVGLSFPLDLRVGEGGQNFSVGERQLLCLARILVSDRSIVFMDEPTSAVDPDTDARIQRVLRTALGDRTVITVAHRLETLQDYDELIEMANGQVIFQGRPGERIGRSN